MNGAERHGKVMKTTRWGREVALSENGTTKTVQVDHYVVRRKIASGGMGAVYEAYEPALDRTVALKFLSPTLSMDPDLVMRFTREAKAAASLHHPNIVAVHFFGSTGGRPYFAMELVVGESLADLAARGPIDEARAADYLVQAAEGLRAAWKTGRVHRDVKPGNLMLSSEGVVKVTDFGLAKALDGDSSLTKTNMIVGTPHFASPEQAQGQAVDCRSDIYSLGATFYAMLTGSVPFDASSPMGVLVRHINDPLPPMAERRPGISAEFSRLIERMMAKKPDDRHGDYDELLAELKALAALIADGKTHADAVSAAGLGMPPAGPGGVIRPSTPAGVGAATLISQSTPSGQAAAPTPATVSMPLPRSTSPSAAGSRARMLSSSLSSIEAPASKRAWWKGAVAVGVCLLFLGGLALAYRAGRRMRRSRQLAAVTAPAPPTRSLLAEEGPRPPDPHAPRPPEGRAFPFDAREPGPGHPPGHGPSSSFRALAAIGADLILDVDPNGNSEFRDMGEKAAILANPKEHARLWWSNRGMELMESLVRCSTVMKPPLERVRGQEELETELLRFALLRPCRPANTKALTQAVIRHLGDPRAWPDLPPWRKKAARHTVEILKNGSPPPVHRYRLLLSQLWYLGKNPFEKAFFQTVEETRRDHDGARGVGWRFVERAYVFVVRAYLRIIARHPEQSDDPALGGFLDLAQIFRDPRTVPLRLRALLFRTARSVKEMGQRHDMTQVEIWGPAAAETPLEEDFGGLERLLHGIEEPSLEELRAIDPNELLSVVFSDLETEVVNEILPRERPPDEGRRPFRPFRQQRFLPWRRRLDRMGDGDAFDGGRAAPDGE